MCKAVNHGDPFKLSTVAHLQLESSQSLGRNCPRYSPVLLALQDRRSNSTTAVRGQHYICPN